jgi:hypothetical protein
MGTYYRITAEGADVVPVLRGCFQDARRLEQVYSRFDADERALARQRRGRHCRAS